MKTPNLKVMAILTLCFAFSLSGAAFGQPAPAAKNSSADLDALVKRLMAEQHIVGASVLVAQNGKILLHAGYGFADLGLEAASKDETVYHIVGPMLPFTGIAVMQLVERGKLSLDDDLSKYIPEFPMQGHHVSIRQLLNHTSGIVDYHYLGDPIEATSREPKALDEVMALYAGKDWVNEPGKKWDWSISGFSLLVTVLERVTGESFPDYMRKNIFTPAGVKSTTYCDDFSVVRGLSHAYRRFGAGYEPANEDDMAYNSDLRFCSTVGDVLQLWRAISEKKLVRPETFKQMSTPEGVAMQMSPTDANAHYGFAMSMNQEEDHKRIGQHGSLMGYSGSLYDFPADHLTIVVLTNTEGQNAYAITRALARAVLGLPDLPAAGGGGNSAGAVLADKAMTSSERAQISGTYILKLERLTPQLHDSFAQYRRTYRVFDENGRLMIEALGGVPERLFKQEDGSFAMRTSPRAHITFAIKDGHSAPLTNSTSMTVDGSGYGAPLSGARVGDGDPRTFHTQR